MNPTDSTGVNRVDVPLFPQRPPVQPLGTGYHAAVDSVCSRHPKFGLLGGAETHAPDLDNGQPPAHSAEPVFPPSEHLALPIPFGSPYHRRPNGRALGD